jgi:hypothetical protein
MSSEFSGLRVVSSASSGLLIMSSEFSGLRVVSSASSGLLILSSAYSGLRDVSSGLLYLPHLTFSRNLLYPLPFWTSFILTSKLFFFSLFYRICIQDRLPTVAMCVFVRLSGCGPNPLTCLLLLWVRVTRPPRSPPPPPTPQQISLLFVSSVETRSSLHSLHVHSFSSVGYWMACRCLSQQPPPPHPTPPPSLVHSPSPSLVHSPSPSFTHMHMHPLIHSHTKQAFFQMNCKSKLRCAN